MRLFIYGLSAADKIDKVWEFFVVILAIVLLVGMFKNEKKIPHKYCLYMFGKYDSFMSDNSIKWNRVGDFICYCCFIAKNVLQKRNK